MISAWWHSSGVYGSLVLVLPVGMPLIRIFNHLVLAQVTGGGRPKWTAMNSDIVGAAGRREFSDVLGLAVRIRFPLAVYFAATRCTDALGELVRS